MSSSDADKTTADGFDIAEDSETMVEIKIKTLDSQTYSLRVNKCVPVPALKEQIATVTGVLSEQQRLICRGKVLKDDQLLSAYHVEDGHTLHLVVRQPLQSASTSYMESEGPSEASSVPGNTHNRGSPVAHSFVFESVNADQGDTDNSIISRILSSMLDSIGATNSRTGPTTTAVRESERLARASGDNGPSDSNRSRPNPANPQSSSSRRQTGSAFPSSVPSMLQNPPVIPDSLTTLNQYISFMEDEFRREGFGSNVSEQIDHTEATGWHLDEGPSRESHSHAPLGGLPSPASLAEILLSSRRLLLEQTGECLSLLARQLEGHTSIMDPQSRMNLQSSAIRSGILMRDLGSLLLELGRTTMTLRMGQTPAEAVVNAGPANFISANGPNPLMVQPVPFYPGPNVAGVHMGSANSGHGQGEQPDSVLIPTRNIEIRIRTAGRAVPVATPGANAAAAGQQQQEQTDSARNLSGASVVHRALTSGESGIRVVPLRTVVAVPSGVNPSTPDSSANSVRMFYPLIARVRPQTTGNASDSRGFEASRQLPQGVSEFEWLSLNQSARQRDNLESNSGGALRNSSRVPANIRPFGSGLNPPANESAAHQGDSHVYFSSRQSPPNNDSNRSNLAFNDTTGGSESHDTANADEEQGVFFANVLRQIMPLLTQCREQGASMTDPSSSATEEIERENLDGSSSSRHHRDPPESPGAKRMKKND